MAASLPQCADDRVAVVAATISCPSSVSEACVVAPSSAALKQTVAAVPGLTLATTAFPASTPMPPLSESSVPVKASMKISPETMAKIERLSELNQLLSKQLNAFRAEIQLHLSRVPALAVAEQNVFRDLDKCLEERQKLTPILRGFF